MIAYNFQSMFDTYLQTAPTICTDRKGFNALMVRALNGSL